MSAQLPPRAIASHVWAEEAKKNTVYLFPLAAKIFINSFVEVLKAEPAAWWQCLAVIAKAGDTSLCQSHLPHPQLSHTLSHPHFYSLLCWGGH